METIANKTVRAVTVIAVLIWSVATIAYLLKFGVQENSLHVSALSWSFTMIGFCLVALLGDAALAGYFGNRNPGG